MTARRIACIFLPSLPIERWQNRQQYLGDAVPDDLPVALAAEGSHGPVVHDLNRAARLAGVQRGTRVVDMRALCPTLHIAQAEPSADAAGLQRLMFWARRWGPHSTMDGDDGLVIDTTGVAHLFGGEADMLADIQARFAGAGLTARVALAPTWGAAWGLARFGDERAICTDTAQLMALPVAALRLSDEVLLLLRRLGLKRLGDLAAIPRLSLMRRFARTGARDNPLIRLDQALGHLAEPVSAPEPPPAFMAQARLAEPVQDPTDWLPGLIADLSAQMAAQDQGCRRLCLSVFRVDGERRDIRVTTAAPTREVAHLLRLFDGRLDRLDPGYGFDLIRLAAEATEPLAAPQIGLDGAVDQGLHLTRLIDRLVARFGAGAVARPVARESHVPERAEAMTAPMAPDLPVTARPDQPRSDQLPADRPIRLLNPPEEVRVLYAVPEGPPALFIWRRQRIQVARHAGPERIAPEWWQDRPGTRLRDYFRIEDPAGRRLWLYREGLADDGRGGPPRWFLHGIFA